MSKTISNLFQSLFTDIIGYIEEGAELLLLKSIDKISSALSIFVSRLFYVFLFLLFFIFFSIAIALLIGEMTGKVFLGFFIAALFHALLGLVFFLLRKRLFKSFFIKKIAKKIYSNEG